MQLKLTFPFRRSSGVKQLCLLFMLTCLTSLSFSQIAVWDFAGLSSPVTATATNFNANLVSTSGGNTITRGAGAASSTASNSFRTVGFQNNGIAVTNTDYFQITLKPALGYTMSLSTIDARMGGTASFTSAPGCSNQFAYSTNGTTFTLIGTPSITTATPAVLPTINVSGISALQNVSSATTIYIRFYASGQTTTGGWGFLSAATAGTPGLSIGGSVVSAGPIPTISSSGALSSLTTVYGTPSSNTSFSLSGADMTAPITVTAPSGYEVSDNASAGFAPSISVGAAGTIPSTSIYVRLKSTATVGSSPYTGNVVCSSTLALNVNVPTISSSVTPLATAITGAIASNKIYDGNTTATITGASAAGVNGDVLTVSGGGVFINKNVGTAKTVNPSLTIGGTNATSYTVIQPTLTADITPLALTIASAAAQTKIFDGTDDAVITGTLTGVISPDVVSFNGTGTFATTSIGTAIPVTSTCTLSGADAGNYTLIQPTGLFADIDPPGLSPQTIVFTLSSPVTYGDGPFTLNGFASSNLPVSYVSSNPLIASVSGNMLTLHGNGTVTITASQPGDNNNFSPAPDVTQTLVIAKKTLTVLNSIGDSKVYDHTNAATFTGTLDGVVGTDNVVLNATGTFAQFAIGVNLTITSTATITGTDVSKYNLTQPTGLIGDITPKALTIANPVVSNKIYDGTTTATLTGTLTGVVLPDVVTLSISASFASSAVGNGISVTSTSIITGLNASNYTLTQPAGLVANIYPVPTLTEDILPQYMQGANGTNSNRLPYAYRVSIHNLLPNATYKYYNTMVINTDAANSTGAGNIIFVNAGGFTRTTSASMTTAGGYNTFVSDANGDYTGWFASEATGNVRFTPGNNVFMRIQLNNGEGGNAIASRVTTLNAAKVINLIAVAGVNNGTGLRGLSNATPKNFVMAYDNTTGTGRPISGTFVESDGTLNTTINSYASFYSANADGVAGAYGMIIPNTNANGIQRMEQRSLLTGAVVGCASQATGVWPGGANTVNPTGGTTSLALSVIDAPLNLCGVTLNLTCFIQGYYTGMSTMASTLLNQGVSGALATECDDVIVELHDATAPYLMAHTFTGKLLTNGTISCSYSGSASGNSYYIVVKHRNTVETWSANPVAFSGTVNYNFSTAVTQAYSDNQFEVETGVFAFYSGDINQDLAIDGFDYILQDPDVISGASGYLATDLTGDGNVDAFDYIALDPNIIAGITIAAP
jgi:YDG domain